MRRSAALAVTTLFVVGSVVGLGACEDAGNEIGEFALRNAAAVAGSAAFSEKGYPLESRLSCKATVSTGDEQASVSCTGTTKDGKPVTLDGQADNEKATKGSFIGKVDGAEVFSRDCLGDC